MQIPDISRRIVSAGPSPSEVSRDLTRLARSSGVDVIGLSGAPSRPLPEHVIAAICAAARGETHSLHSAGLIELRQAIARRTEEMTGSQVDPETNVVVTNGAMHALLVSAMALGNAGDEIVIPAPCFFFGGTFELAGLRSIYVPSVPETGWSLDFAGIRRAFDAGARLLCLTTPNNPTGYLLTERDFDELASMIVGRDVWILSDESYEAMAFDGSRTLSPLSHPGLRPHTIGIQTFSKTYQLRDQRVGYAVAPNASAGRAIRSAVERTVLSVGHIAQRAAQAALEGPQDWVRQMVAEVQVNRDVMERTLRAARNVSWLHPHAGPYLYVDVSGLGSADDVAYSLLVDHGVATVAGSAFQGGDHLRVPFGGPSDRIQEASERMVRAFAKMTLESPSKNRTQR